MILIIFDDNNMKNNEDCFVENAAENVDVKIFKKFNDEINLTNVFSLFNDDVDKSR